MRMELKKFRRRKGLTLTELARRSGVDLSILSRLESGQRQSCNAANTLAIARALNIKPEQLLEPGA